MVAPPGSNPCLLSLRYLKDKQISHVLIHDAVRPFFDHVLLDRIAESLDTGAQAVLLKQSRSPIR